MMVCNRRNSKGKRRRKLKQGRRRRRYSLYQVGTYHLMKKSLISIGRKK